MQPSSLADLIRIGKVTQGRFPIFLAGPPWSSAFRNISLTKRCLPAVQVAAMLLLTILSGCRDSTGQRATIAVRGTVTFNGKPVSGASVFFVTDNGDTDAQGHFQLMTYRRGDGAVAGSFRVGISKFVLDPATAKDPVASSKNELPDRYSNPATSNLTAKVEAGGKNDFVFELTE